jgi:hypothetical protein
VASQYLPFSLSPNPLHKASGIGYLNSMTRWRDGFIAFSKEFVFVSIPEAYRTPGCLVCGLNHSSRQDSNRAETSNPFIEFVGAWFDLFTRSIHSRIVAALSQHVGSLPATLRPR